MNTIEYATASSRPTAPTIPPCDELLSSLDAERSRLRRWLGRWLGSDDDADDAIQEAMIAAWQNLDELQRMDSPQAWLSRCAHNAAATLLRRGSARCRRELAWGAGNSVTVFELHEVDEDAPTVAVLEEALAALPRRTSDLITVVHLHGRCVAEVADQERQTSNAVRVRLHRARRELRQTVTAILQARETAPRRPSRSVSRESVTKKIHSFGNPRPSAASTGRRVENL